MAENTKESSSEDKVLVVRHFHPGLCAKCYKRPTQKDKMKNCAQCQLVSYCSKACQKSDWKEHKPFCRVNAVEDGKNVFSTARAQNDEDWFKFRSSLQIAANVNLGRKLKPFEREIIWSPKVCEVCRESNPTKLIACPTCFSVFYCSSDHMEENIENHADWCSRYLTITSVDSFEHSRGLHADLPLAINVFKCYSPLQKDMTELLNDEMGLQKIDAFSGVIYNILMSERLTDPLTLLKTMESFYIGKDQLRINQVRELVVHVVGAESMREMMGMIRWEYLAHRLPSLKELTVMFVGPDVMPEDSEPLPEGCFMDTDEVMSCEDCRKDGRVFMYGIGTMEYHKFIKRDQYTKPDVIVAYNCGFHEFSGLANDTWPESVEIMMSDPTVPLIFTSYTKSEAQKDLQVIRNVKEEVEVTIPTHLNPYKSLRPVRDFCREDGNHIFYINHYMTCVNGQRI